MIDEADDDEANERVLARDEAEELTLAVETPELERERLPVEGVERTGVGSN